MRARRFVMTTGVSSKREHPRVWKASTIREIFHPPRVLATVRTTLRPSAMTALPTSRSLFRSLLRARAVAFRGDAKALAASRTEIRKHFDVRPLARPSRRPDEPRPAESRAHPVSPPPPRPDRSPPTSVPRRRRRRSRRASRRRVSSDCTSCRRSATSGETTRCGWSPNTWTASTRSPATPRAGVPGPVRRNERRRTIERVECE